MTVGSGDAVGCGITVPSVNNVVVPSADSKEVIVEFGANVNSMYRITLEVAVYMYLTELFKVRLVAVYATFLSAVYIVNFVIVPVPLV
ncbi:hypothetical protein D3C73_1221680 [compost metagenome]